MGERQGLSPVSLVPDPLSPCTGSIPHVINQQQPISKGTI